MAAISHHHCNGHHIPTSYLQQQPSSSGWWRRKWLPAALTVILLVAFGGLNVASPWTSILLTRGHHAADTRQHSTQAPVLRLVAVHAARETSSQVADLRRTADSGMSSTAELPLAPHGEQQQVKGQRQRQQQHTYQAGGQIGAETLSNNSSATLSGKGSSVHTTTSSHNAGTSGTPHFEQAQGTDSISNAGATSAHHSSSNSAGSDISAAALLSQDQPRQQLVSTHDNVRGIPRIIHQSYLSGQAALLSAALQPRAHFRKEWWASCKTHHRAWQHILWDTAASEQLLQTRYPWFLNTWRRMSTNVLKSDAIRPFILHAYGGVYLDMDTECLRSMDHTLQNPASDEPWDLILSAEKADLINNAQMASSAGHPFWQLVQRAIVEEAGKGTTDPLYATGPHLLTAAFNRYANLSSDTCPGTHPTPHGTHAHVYGQGEWFTPCNWDDWGCHVALARTKASYRRQSKVVGVHHFSGSWLGLDGSRSLALMNEAMSGIVQFLQSNSSFIEAACQHPRLLGSTAPGGLHYQVCWEVLARDISTGNCSVVSVREEQGKGQLRRQKMHMQQTQHHGQALQQQARQAQQQSSRGQQNDLEQDQQQRQQQQQDEEEEQYAFEFQLADAGCAMQLFTPDAGPSAAVMARHPNVKHTAAVLRGSSDPFAFIPAQTLAELLPPGTRLTLLHMQCNDCIWDVMNQQYLQSLQTLDQVDLLLLAFPSPQQAQHHRVYAMYQHLYQELGFLGYHHSTASQARPGGSITSGGRGSVGNSSTVAEYRLGLLHPKFRQQH